MPHVLIVHDELAFRRHPNRLLVYVACRFSEMRPTLTHLSLGTNSAIVTCLQASLNSCLISPLVAHFT